MLRPHEEEQNSSVTIIRRHLSSTACKFGFNELALENIQREFRRHPYENDNLRQASDKLPLIDGHTRASLRIASLIFKITSLRFTHSLMSAHPQACSKLFF